MTAFLQLLVLGMATGGFYTINALGIVTVFRSSGIINFAAGGTAMIGGYLAWQFADQMGWPHPVAIVAAVLLAGLVGCLIYLVAILPLNRASNLTKVISTLAVLVGLQQVVVLVFGGLPKVPAKYLPAEAVTIGGVRVGEDSLIFLGFTVVLTLVLWAAYRYTRFGLATSALSENPRSLAALGWHIGRLRAVNWFIAGALSGIAGAGIGPFLQLNTVNFTAMLIPTLASAVLGGLRSFPLTLLGGLFVGAAQAEATRYIHWTGAGDAVPFVLIILVLMLRGRSLPLRSYVQERLPRVGSGFISPVRIVVVVVVVGVVAALVSTEWVIGASATIFIATILLSQVVITGYAGQLSLAQLTIGGVGAIVAVNVASATGVPFLLSLIVGMVAIIPVSVLLGLPSLRARGVSLAIATLGFAVAINSLVLANAHLTGGVNGVQLPPQELFGWSISAVLYPLRYFYVSLVVFTLLALMVANLRRGRSGRRLLALRSNERAAAALGVNVARAKLYAFVLAGSIAAAGGVLMTFSVGLPQFLGFDAIASLNSVVSVVLGGIGYIGGTLIGGGFAPTGLPNAILFPLTSQWSWWNSVFPLITGFGLVAQLIFNPNGIVDVIVHGPARAAKKARGRRREDRAQPLAGAVAEERVEVPGSPPAEGAAVQPTRSHRSRTPERSAAGRRARRREREAEQYRRELERAKGEARQFRGTPLTVRDVRVAFGSVVAVDGVSFTVEPGEVLAVIGPNGAGKTTLMDAITGFVDMSGSVELGGTPITRWPAYRRARAGLSRSFQSLELLEDMTVLDNLRCAAEPQDAASLLIDLVHPNRSRMSSATAAAITAFGLEKHLLALPTELGYGDRRLVAIARAVAGEPSVLLLDEPAAGLSERERAEVSRLITMMAKEWNIAVLLIEHDVSLVRRVSDRVIALDFGAPVAAGTPGEVLSSPAVIESYLGAPHEEPDSAPTAPPGDASPVPQLIPSPTGASAAPEQPCSRPADAARDPQTAGRPAEVPLEGWK